LGEFVIIKPGKLLHKAILKIADVCSRASKCKAAKDKELPENGKGHRRMK
jgi:hypothetical protein